MCGIHVAISAAGKRTISPALERRLRNRGPDHTGTVTTRVGDTTLTFTSTVLSLRGDHVVKQPLIDVETGSVLCWNGEAWTLRGNSILGNDGQAILSSLSKASRHGLADRDGDDDDNFNDTGVLDVLREIKGPFAFVFLDRPAKRLYYGRDRLGRRSMLVSPGQPFLLSSVADYTLSDWVEVEPDGIYMVQLQEIDMAPKQPVPVRYGWAEDESLVRVARRGIACPRKGDYRLSSSCADIRHRNLQFGDSSKVFPSDQPFRRRTPAAAGSHPILAVAGSASAVTPRSISRRRQDRSLVFWRSRLHRASSTGQ